MKTSQALRVRLRAKALPFLANDNIAAVLEPGDLEDLKVEVEAAVHTLLQALVIDVERDHNTEETAKRVAKMFLEETFRGRYQPRPAITSFPNAKQLGELYVAGPITVRSTCSHHLVPIIGRCWIGVIPGERVIGLSKFNRLTDWILARPQIQEEGAVQLADEIERVVAPKGLAVVIKANHMCMTARGVREPADAAMTTSVVRGVLMEDAAARAEFLSLINL